MALKKLELRISEDLSHLRLDEILGRWIPTEVEQAISKSKIRQLIMAGAVQINGKKCNSASQSVRLGSRVSVFLDLGRLYHSDQASKDLDVKISESDILFEDEFIIAFNKPAGLPTQATLDPSRKHLFGLAKELLQARNPSEKSYLALHHRLDRDTSGVLLLAKSESANRGVADLFKEHRIQKTYFAICENHSSVQKNTWTVKNYLAKDFTKRKVSRFHSVKSGGDPAETDFKILDQSALGLFIQAQPKTGRTHQIRVHLSEEGLPIVGDSHYGWNGEGIRRVMLHAKNLKFIHPISQVETFIQAPLPEDFLETLKKYQLRDLGL